VLRSIGSPHASADQSVYDMRISYAQIDIGVAEFKSTRHRKNKYRSLPREN